MNIDKFNTMTIALLPAVIMIAALIFGLMFHANTCCGDLVQCPNCRATIDTNTNSYHYSVVRRSYGSYGSTGGYSYGSAGGTPTQVLPRPLSVVQRLRSLLVRPIQIIEVAPAVPAVPTTPKSVDAKKQ